MSIQTSLKTIVLVFCIYFAIGCAHNSGGWVSSGVTDTKKLYESQEKDQMKTASAEHSVASFSLSIDQKVVIDHLDIECIKSKGKSYDFYLTNEGQKKFSNATRENIGKNLDVIFCGKISSSPVIRSQMTLGFFSIDIKNERDKDCLDLIRFLQCSH